MELKVFVFGICLLCAGGGLSLNPALWRSQPGLKSPPKLWWAKEITPDLYIAGRLTFKQIKYASEGGFESILSLYIYEDNDPSDYGGEYLPTTSEAKSLAESLGLGYKALIGKKADWWTAEVVEQFSKAIEDLPRPILLHCNRGYTITYVTLMHLAKMTKQNPKFKPKIYSTNFYKISASMGLDFTADHIKKVVAAITGEKFVKNPPKPDPVPTNWRDFWPAHPVAKNWYSAGQITKSDINVLEKSGFKSVVNVRVGLTYKGKPSQEQVNLLNIKDETETYGCRKYPPRQGHVMLERNRIYPYIGNDYIGKGSKVNYESENPDEFGDDVGYNETMERMYFIEHALAYFHLPMSKYTCVVI